MLALNKFLFYAGMIVSVIGTLVGIPLLIFGEKTIGLYLVTIVVPIGFLLWFTGFVAYTFLRPNSNREEDERAHAEAQKFQRSVPD
ncbi:hypothetical protein [Ignatzschineria sp. LJL83]